MLTTNDQASRKPRKHRLVIDATWRGRGRNGESGKPSGPGFKIHGVWCSLMLPLVIEVTAISVHDKTGGVTLLLPELERVLAKLGRKLRVMVADAAYWGVDFITGLMKLGFVPCIHESSHKDAEKTRCEVERKNETFIPIQDPRRPTAPEEQEIRFTKWWSNGHLEFFCECGQGRTEMDISLGRKGQALIRTDLQLRGLRRPDHHGQPVANHPGAEAVQARVERRPRRRPTPLLRQPAHLQQPPSGRVRTRPFRLRRKPPRPTPARLQPRRQR